MRHTAALSQNVIRFGRGLLLIVCGLDHAERRYAERPFRRHTDLNPALGRKNSTPVHAALVRISNVVHAPIAATHTVEMSDYFDVVAELDLVALTPVIGPDADHRLVVILFECLPAATRRLAFAGVRKRYDVSSSAL